MTISEASAQFGLTPDTLRYYEKIGLLPPVPRNKSGLRDYDEESCNWIGFIKCMRSAGLSIEVLIEYVSLWLQGDETVEERRALLVAQRKKLTDKLTEIQSTIERLDFKIDHYDKTLMGMAFVKSNQRE
ncbi:MAG: MerR family transcriptional regulator [Oscillospiraceae bacterium]